MKTLSLSVVFALLASGCSGTLSKLRFSPSEMAKGYGKVLCRGWAKPSGNIVGYNLYASQRKKGPFHIANKNPIRTNQYIIYGVRKWVRIYWRVTAVDRFGQEGPPSPVRYSVARE